VARRYGAEFVVARSEPPLGLTDVFAVGSADPEAGGFAIYRVDPAASQAKSASAPSAGGEAP
jgi:hypothetical protein